MLRKDNNQETPINIASHNKEAWNQETEKGNIWTKPVSTEIVEKAKNGEWNVVLTPIIPVPKSWFGGDIKGKKILCLASGGGQQAPVFAAAGAEVTVFDNSPNQLASDEMVAKRDNLTIKTMQGDMRDLSIFADESFDLIFHPVSNCFIDEITVVWRECYRVLKKGGILLSGFGNPLSYIFDWEEWDNRQNIKVSYKIPYSDLEQLPKDQLESKIIAKETLYFGHTLDDQIGGQINAGFAITGFYEDGGAGDFIDKYIKVFIATKAVKN